MPVPLCSLRGLLEVLEGTCWEMGGMLGGWLEFEDGGGHGAAEL